MDVYVIINAGAKTVTDWLGGWVGHGGGAPTVTKCEVIRPRGCEASPVWVCLICEADRATAFDEGVQRPREVIRIELQALSEDRVQVMPHCYTAEAVDCLVELLDDMGKRWPEVAQQIVALAWELFSGEEADSRQTARQGEQRELEALLGEASRAVEASSGAEMPFWDEQLSPEEQMERYVAMRDDPGEWHRLVGQYLWPTVLKHADTMERKYRALKHAADTMERKYRERADEGAFAPPLQAPESPEARRSGREACEPIIDRREEQREAHHEWDSDDRQPTSADLGRQAGGTPRETVLSMHVDDDGLLQCLAERADWWIATHPPCPSALAKLLRFELPPLLGVEDEEGGGLGTPDWPTVERLLKSRTELFFHWEANVVVCRAGECPVLDEVSRILRLPGISGEIYEKCHEILSQPTGFEAYWVFRHYPIMTQKIIWTLIFYVVLKEGLRYHYREQQRKRRDKTVSLDELVPTGDGEVSLHETVTTPVGSEPNVQEAEAPDLGRLFRPLTKREREVAHLLAEGHKQTTIAELLELTPGRLSQLVSQLRGKSRTDPTRS